MNKRKLLAAACVIGVACDIALLGAAPEPAPATKPASISTGLDSARNALADKRYDDVDAALAELLARKAPDAAALRLSLDAALASGRPVTANLRANELLKSSAGHDLDVLYSSAATADAVGDSRTAQVRYLGFVRQSEAKSDKLQFALDYVMAREAYPEEFKKSVRLFGADSHAWRAGQAQLARLIEAADADRTLDLAGYLIDTFPDADRTDAVHQMIRNAAEAYVFGKEPKDRYVKALLMLAKHPGRDPRYVENLLGNAAPAMDAESRIGLILDLLSASKTALHARHPDAVWGGYSFAEAGGIAIAGGAGVCRRWSEIYHDRTRIRGCRARFTLRIFARAGRIAAGLPCQRGRVGFRRDVRATSADVRRKKHR